MPAMRMSEQPVIPLSDHDAGGDVALQHATWRNRVALSSISEGAEAFLGQAGFDRAPWMAVGLVAGVTAWFNLKSPEQWLLLIAGLVIAAMAAHLRWRGRDERTNCLTAATTLVLCVALGVLLIWTRSAIVGAVPIDRPTVGTFEATVLERIDQPSRERVRLVLALREKETHRPIKVRVNVPKDKDQPGLREGTRIELKARLMPPASPSVPGGYDFARAAWFIGLSATGSALGDIRILDIPAEQGGLAKIKRDLASHVRSQLDGSPGTIAAAFASGDRGAISKADDDAMRDAGLTHLLSISGLHVSAVIAAGYFLAIKILALFPALVLRVRLPILAAAVGAAAGIGYTLLTGSEVPTVRSCIAAVLVLIALALGREALSMRMIAAAAIFVMLLWPESVAGPSFQMSFAAVISIVALAQSAPVKQFLAPREEGFLARSARGTAMLLLTGIVIELALMPIGLFHFHRAGVYGALANVIAIPLTTFITMPLIAIALLCDLAGLGAPFWWLVGQSLELLLSIAHYTAEQPGAVKRLPHMGNTLFAVFAVGGLWLALWRGRARLLGLIPVGIASVFAYLTPAPDILVTNDGRHVAISGMGKTLLSLRDTNSEFTRDNLLELSGSADELTTFAEWPGAQCNRDFCSITIERAGRDWHILAARGQDRVEERALAAACDRADIVIADRYLPRSCQPVWLKADGRYLRDNGGLAIYLHHEKVVSVADSQGGHGWWSGGKQR